MNHKNAAWQKTFGEFAGPGIHHPSDMMEVGEAEARTLLAGLAAQAWGAPSYIGKGRHGGYTVRPGAEPGNTGLFFNGGLVGFYAGSYVWIHRHHRGQGLATPLILAAASQRGGAVLPPGVVFQGYSAVGLAAHRSAHLHAVLTAVAAGLPVPAPVLDEMHRNGHLVAAVGHFSWGRPRTGADSRDGGGGGRSCPVA